MAHLFASPGEPESPWKPIETLPADFARPFVETNGQQYAARCKANAMGGLMQSEPATWGCVVRPTHWMPLPAAPASAETAESA